MSTRNDYEVATTAGTNLAGVGIDQGTLPPRLLHLCAGSWTGVEPSAGRLFASCSAPAGGVWHP